LLSSAAHAAGRLFEIEHFFSAAEDGALFITPSHADARRDGRLILVAEDNETNQIVILRQLALLGFSADIADNGKVALEYWRSGKYALLLSDLHMPEMDGCELTVQIRAQERDGHRIPIIALAANALQGEADHCRAAGMDNYLSKPLRLADLETALAIWLPAASVSVIPARGDDSLVQSGAQTVDVGVLASLVGNDPVVLVEFLKDFQISAAKIAGELSAGYVSHQTGLVGEQAHKLKSSARAVGALRLGHLCAEIEAASSAGMTDSLAALVSLFGREFDAVNTILDSLPAGTTLRASPGNKKE